MDDLQVLTGKRIDIIIIYTISVCMENTNHKQIIHGIQITRIPCT